MLDCTGSNSYSLGCGMFDNLNVFQSEETTKVKWGENEILQFSTVSTSKSLCADQEYNNPTPIFTAIENQQWSNVLSILRNKTNRNQLNIWIVKKTSSGDIEWRKSSLHSALLCQAPLDVVKLIIELSPQLASLSDNEGNLPIHIAFKIDARDEILYQLLVAYPLGTNAKNIDGLNPLQCGIYKDPNNYRWKVIGTYTAMMKNMKKKETAIVEGTTAKSKRLKKVFEMEIDHLNIEFNTKINECNSHLIASQKEVLGKQEIISQLQEKLVKGSSNMIELQDELRNLNEAKLNVENQLKTAQDDFQKLSSVQSSLQKTHQDSILQEQALKHKVQELQDQLSEYRSSFFGGQIKDFFNCE